MNKKMCISGKGDKVDIIVYLQSFSSPFLDTIFEYATMLGEEYFAMALFGTIFWCLDKEFGYRLGLTFLTTGLVNSGLKELFRIPRPIGNTAIRSLRLETAPGYSFPSGHTQMTTTLWVSLIKHFKRRWVSILGVFIIAIVAISRLYLGVHYLTDVIGAIVVGTMWVFIANKLFDYMKQGNRTQTLLLMALPAIFGMFLVRNHEFYQLSGTFFGLLAGYSLETRKIQFSVQANAIHQALKVLVGLTGALAIRAVLKGILPPALLSDTLRYFLVAMWITAGAPFLFARALKGTLPKSISSN